jgi:hypothetical protein
MCYIKEPGYRIAVHEAVKNLTARNKIFTGREVQDDALKIVEKGVAATLGNHYTKSQINKSQINKTVISIVGDLYTGSQISAYVREMYNGHDEVFSGYASYPVPQGPLLYFPVSCCLKQVKNRVEKIEASLLQNVFRYEEQEDELPGSAIN